MEPDIGELAKIWPLIVSRNHAVEVILASATMLQLYDWLLILPQEVEYVWRASWNWSKALYLITRYTPFICVALELRNELTPNPTPESCVRIVHVITWLAFVAMACSEIVFIVRTYAVWKRDKRVGIGLVLLFILCQISVGIILGKWIGAAHPIQNPYPEIYRGCIFNKSTRLIFASWVVLTIEEGVDLVLMIISAVNTCRERRSNLMHVVYRDGIRFYLFIFCATLANILITLLLPSDFIGIGSIVEVVLHSTLACRLMVGIREATQSFGPKPETFELSEVPRYSILEFVRRSLGEGTQMNPGACAGPSKV